MSEYNPDSFLIIRFGGDEVTYKVLGGWSGGYTQGSSWRVNSGIEKVEKLSDGSYNLISYSGSVYHVHPDQERYTMAMVEVVTTIGDLKQLGRDIKIIDFKEFLKEWEDSYEL